MMGGVFMRLGGFSVGVVKLVGPGVGLVKVSDCRGVSVLAGVVSAGMVSRTHAALSAIKAAELINVLLVMNFLVIAIV